MRKNAHPVVVVKKRKSHGTGHHGGSWKIAYADFMTAMMAFFLVMWLISSSSPQDRKKIAEYFNMPIKVAMSHGDRESLSSSVIPGGGDDAMKKEGEIQRANREESRRRDLDNLRKIHERLDLLIKNDSRLHELQPHLKIALLDDGLRIQIIDSNNSPMFERGSAIVEPYMRDILRKIAPVLNDVPNRISLSGHTDDHPYSGGDRGYSNWELSTDRANASRRELISGGLGTGKVLRVVGMADTMNLRDLPGDNAANRRISILILTKEKEQDILQENIAGEEIRLSGDAGKLLPELHSTAASAQ